MVMLDVRFCKVMLTRVMSCPVWRLVVSTARNIIRADLWPVLHVRMWSSTASVME